jgi:GST-like protein
MFAAEESDEDAMGYVLYGDKGSGASAVEMALAEAGVDYEFKTISLEENQQKSKAFLKINPSGKMPALKLPTGEIVTESSALLVAIGERHPRAKLLPPLGSADRAQAYRWLAFMASEIYPMVEIVDYPERFAPKGKQADALREKARARIRERILTAQKAIAGPWFLESGFSVVDIYLSMFSRWSVGKEWRTRNLKPLLALSRRLSARPKIEPVWQKHFPNPI